MRRLIAQILIFSLFGQTLLYAQGRQENYTNELYFHEDFMDKLDERFNEWMKEGQEKPMTKDVLGAYEKVFSEIEEYRTNRKIRDPYLLKNQVVHDYNHNKVYQLSNPEHRMLLDSYAFRFDHEVKVGTNEKGALYFQYEQLKKGESKPIVRHTFAAIKPLKITQDAEFIHVLTKEGKIYSMSMALAQAGTFEVNLPWSLTAKVHKAVLRDIKKNLNNVEFHVDTRGVEPVSRVNNVLYKHADAYAPNDIDSLKYKYRAGDLVLIENIDGKRRLLGHFIRENIWAFMHESANTLSKIYKLFVENGMIDGKAANVPDYEGNQLNDRELELRKTYEKEIKVASNVTDQLVIAAKNNGFLAQNPPQRDLFDYIERVSDFEEIARNAEERLDEVKDIKEERRDKWQDLLTRKTSKVKKMNPYMKAFLWGLGSLTTFFAADYAIFAAKMGEGPLWMAHTMLSIQTLIPNVVMEYGYIWLGLASAVWLLLALPIVDKISQAVGKIRQMHEYVALALGGIRLRAIMVTPVHVMAGFFLRQKNIVEASNQGLNPFKKIKANSELGQKLGLEKDVRLGVNNPLRSFKTEEGKKLNEIQQKAIHHLKEQDNRREALAWLLASIVVSKRHNIDEGTLTFMFKNGLSSLSKEELSDPEFKKRWAKTARDLYHSKHELLRSTPEDFKSISFQQINEYVKIATEIAKDAGSHEIRKTLKVRWENLKVRLYAAIDPVHGIDAYAEDMRVAPKHENQIKSATKDMYRDFKEWNYDFFIRDKNWEKLSKGMPTIDNATQTVTQFKNDYAFSAVLSVFAGARALAEQPIYLAADPEGPLQNTRPHAVDMGEQVFIYMVPAMASNFLVYQNEEGKFITEAVNIDQRFEPFEKIALDGDRRDATKWTSWKRFTKEILRFKKMGYGYIFWKEFWLRWVNIRATVITGVPIMMLGGIDPVSAFLAIVWTGFVGKWLAGWLWTPAFMGPTNAKETYRIENERLRNAKTKISQGIKTKDHRMVQEGYDILQDLYLEHSKKMRENFNDTLVEKAQHLVKGNERMTSKKFFEQVLTENKIPVNRKSLKDVEGIMKSSLGLQASLIMAIEKGDQAKIEEARARLVEVYINHHAPNDKLMTQDALSLLRYSLRNPPLPRDFNEKVNANIQLVTGGLTTFLFSFMFANILDPEQDAWARLLDGMTWGSQVYILLLLADKYMVDPIGDWWGERSAYKKIKKKYNVKVRSCLSVFN